MGPVDYVVKPFPPTELTARIANRDGPSPVGGPRTIGAANRYNHSGRTTTTIIWYPGGARLDHGSAGSSTEAEAYGRQDTAGSGSSVGNE